MQMPLTQFLLGAVVMACLIIGLFFLRFWRKSRDRLFVYFALTFWLLGAGWLCLAFVTRDETRLLLYMLRLVAFAVLLLGIWDKNRRKRPG